MERGYHCWVWRIVQPCGGGNRGAAVSLNSPNETTLNSPNETTLNSPNETTLNSPNETTLNSPNETTLNSPNETTLNSPNRYNLRLALPIMAEYRPRIVDEEIQRKLKAFGAVSIVGPRGCGKTASAERMARSSMSMRDPAKSGTYRQVAELKPSVLLRGEKPRLIGEWQEAPRLWDAVRFAVDQGAGPGAFILTSSARLPAGSTMHTGTGRIVNVAMRPMSLSESGDSTGEVSLSELFGGASDICGESLLDCESMAGALLRGGLPSAFKGGMGGYCEAILGSDISIPGGRRRSRGLMSQVMKSLARHSSEPFPSTAVLEEVNGSEKISTINTISDYISALKSLYLLEDLSAWNPKLRRRTAIRTSDTRHMCDPAIAAHFLGYGDPAELVEAPRLYEGLFRSMAVRDLRVYSQKIGGTVRHYRDADGLEADAIVHLDNGRWAAFEVKLGAHAADEAAKSLKKLAGKVDGDITKPAAFLAVITASGYAYTREDGVHVIPLGCLKD